MSDKSRRKLLKSIAAGSGAIVTGKSLPESWSRPVVDAVMLPVHAQTSPACPTPRSLSIPGVTNLCSNPSGGFQSYRVDDITDECQPILVVISGGVNPTVQVITVRRRPTGIETEVSVGGVINNITQNCGNPDPDSQTVIQSLFQAESGASWTATYTLSRTATQTQVSNISLSPN